MYEGCVAFDFTYLESTYANTYVLFKYVKSKPIIGAGTFISTMAIYTSQSCPPGEMSYL